MERSEKFIVISYLNDLSGKPIDDPQWSSNPRMYYSGRGLWSEKFGKAYLFDTRHEAAEFITKRRKGTSWNNKSLQIYATTEKEKFTARLKDE